MKLQIISIYQLQRLYLRISKGYKKSGGGGGVQLHPPKLNVVISQNELVKFLVLFGFVV